MRVGWIGAGLMGVPMARRVLGAGHELAVHTRTEEKARPLLEAGASWAPTPAAAAADRDAVCTMLALPSDVESVYLGAGVLAACRPGCLAIDLSTSSPQLARRLADEGRRARIDVLDAPVSGGPMGAEQGTLSIMVGGSTAAVERARPLLASFGATIVRQGEPGAGQTAKLVNQILIAGVMGGLAEAFALVQALRLEPELVLESVRDGAAGSFLLSWAWPRLMAGDLAPGFKIDHFVKDLTLALDEARGAGLTLPVTGLVAELYLHLTARGAAAAGTQALVEAIHPKE